MHTPIDKAERDLVAAVLLVVSGATSVTLEVDEYNPIPTWDSMVILTVGRFGALDALELDDDVIAAFSAVHPPSGRYVIDVDAVLTAPLAPPIPLPLPAPVDQPIPHPLVVAS